MNQESKIHFGISDPNLKDKVRINLTGSPDVIYWFIRFNVPLDESTVNEKSMEVTDTDGYVMRTDIAYEAEKNGIIISPLDTYEEQRYYILKISTGVRSAKGQQLQSPINIVFKLYQKKIANYQILQKDVPVPESIPRPDDYDDNYRFRPKNDLDNYVDYSRHHVRMTPDQVRLNPILAILGLLTVLIGFAASNTGLIIASAAICLLGVAHIYSQWRNKVFRAKIHYNKGVQHYNKMEYQQAKIAFNKALEINPQSELVKQAVARVGVFKAED